LEKVKSQLEAENADLTTELRSVGASRQECERRRKQAESQLVELQSKFVELDRSRADVTDRFAKLQQESDAIAAQLEQAELRTSAATKSAAAMESQLSEAQVICHRFML
jgi:myosin protein heavy chain